MASVGSRRSATERGDRSARLVTRTPRRQVPWLAMTGPRRNSFMPVTRTEVAPHRQPVGGDAPLSLGESDFAHADFRV